MKTRNAGTPKSATPKKTPPARKSAADTTVASPDPATTFSTGKKTPPARKSAADATMASPDPATTSSAGKKTQPARKSAADATVASPDPATTSAAGKKTPPSRKYADATVALADPETTSAAGKKTRLARKSAADAKMTRPEPKKESHTPKPTDTQLTSAIKAEKIMGNDSTPVASTDPKLESPESSGIVQVAPKKKVTRTVVRKVVRKKAKAASNQSPKSEEVVKLRVGESPEKEEVEGEKDMKSSEQQDLASGVGKSTNEGNSTMEVEEPPTVDVGELEKLEQSVAVKPEEHMDTEEHSVGVEEKVVKEEEVNEEIKNDKDIEVKVEPANVEGALEGENEKCEDEHPHEEELEHGEERLKENGEENLKELGDEELVDHGAPALLEEAGNKVLLVDDVAKAGDEAGGLEQEHMELTAHAKERSIKKELEIFVGGLERDVGDDDVKKAFENVGEVVEVRLHKDLSSNRAKGYAFVKFANKEQASRALSEVKNPIIGGKRCGTAPSEDNDTLFLGNICNTWTKEAIKQKMKDYGVEGVANITLVADPRHEGKSRGFAFVEFSCHADAMLAYKRLQKPDVLFGHAERTAKVAFAEPVREPDPEIMAQVKSVFVDGLPPHWDEDSVKHQFNAFGEIEKIVLARNMSSAKRMDFGFVDFSTHEAAVACVDGINKTELIDGNSKIKVKARLSNPLPKTQAVKGGMCGGFRIGRGGGTSVQQGRGFGLSQPSNRENFQRGRGVFPHGRGQIGRMGFVREQDYDYPYADFHGRPFFEQGGRRGGAAQERYDRGGPSHDVIDGGRGRHFSSRRPPFSPEGGFARPLIDRRFDDPYLYEDIPHGMKRPFYMTDPGYPEPSRHRPRLDYSEPPSTFRETHYRDAFGTRGMHSHDYYGPDYGGAYSSFYGADRPYRGGYY